MPQFRVRPRAMDDHTADNGTTIKIAPTPGTPRGPSLPLLSPSLSVSHAPTLAQLNGTTHLHSPLAFPPRMLALSRDRPRFTPPAPAPPHCLSPIPAGRNKAGLRVMAPLPAPVLCRHRPAPERSSPCASAAATMPGPPRVQAAAAAAAAWCQAAHPPPSAVQRRAHSAGEVGGADGVLLSVDGRLRAARGGRGRSVGARSVGEHYVYAPVRAAWRACHWRGAEPGRSRAGTCRQASGHAKRRRDLSWPSLQAPTPMQRYPG